MRNSSPSEGGRPRIILTNTTRLEIDPLALFDQFRARSAFSLEKSLDLVVS